MTRETNGPMTPSLRLCAFALVILPVFRFSVFPFVSLRLCALALKFFLPPPLPLSRLPVFGVLITFYVSRFTFHASRFISLQIIISKNR